MSRKKKQQKKQSLNRSIKRSLNRYSVVELESIFPLKLSIFDSESDTALPVLGNCYDLMQRISRLLNEEDLRLKMSQDAEFSDLNPVSEVRCRVTSAS